MSLTWFHDQTWRFILTQYIKGGTWLATVVIGPSKNQGWIIEHGDATIPNCGFLVPQMGRWTNQNDKLSQKQNTKRDFVAWGTNPKMCHFQVCEVFSTSAARDKPWLMIFAHWWLDWNVILAGWCVNMVLNSPLLPSGNQTWLGNLGNPRTKWAVLQLASHVWLPDGSPFVKGTCHGR